MQNEKPKSGEDFSGLLTAQEIRELCGISQTTLSRWIAEGAPHRMRANRRYFDAIEFRRWVRERPDRRRRP